MSFKIDVKPLSEWSVDESRKFHEMSLKDRLNYTEEVFKKELPKYIREYNRVMKREKNSWRMTKESFYENPYWMDEVEKIQYYGGKNYAQFQLHDGGVLTAEEVDAWK